MAQMNNRESIPPIEPRFVEGFGEWWRWDCPACHYGDLFLTEGRCQESIDTHLRIKHNVVRRGMAGRSAAR
jgi:hypothetical protein